MQDGYIPGSYVKFMVGKARERIQAAIPGCAVSVDHGIDGRTRHEAAEISVSLHGCKPSIVYVALRSYEDPSYRVAGREGYLSASDDLASAIAAVSQDMDEACQTAFAF